VPTGGIHIQAECSAVRGRDDDVHRALGVAAGGSRLRH
jgi:hypothetical protein